MSTANKSKRAPIRPRGGGAVMSTRHEGPKALDDFPTPPWATRALCSIVLPTLGLPLQGQHVHEPAAGRGIMAGVLLEYTNRLTATDVHAYPDAIAGLIDCVGSYVGDGSDVLAPIPAVDWTITNPPFRLASAFLARALADSEVGVAMLLRSNWSEGVKRYNEVFARTPPLCEAVFVERVPMQRGRWNPNGRTMTAYSWFVWLKGSTVGTRKLWIPPGQRVRLTLPDDVKRYAALEGPTP